ncbi:MAG: T9SS type A sorting domain-containing protein [Bacteroidales bacterium]|nr:T9SS type A sorting domain-containing protein [Bacteroidales bacterium]
MMKTLLTVILGTVVLSFSLQAQLVITHATHAPEIGDQIATIYSDAYTNINPGEAGAGKNWDFSPYTATETETMQFVDPEQTLWGGQVPNSNIAIQFDQDETLAQFMHLSSDVLKVNYMGIYEEVALLMEYTDAMDVMHYPFAYGDNFEDTYGYTMEYDYGGTILEMVTTGTIETVADAWGTLTTPYGTFSNVLRVKITDTESYETYMGGVLVDSGTDTYITYEWYGSSCKYPLAIIDIDLEYPDETAITYSTTAISITEMSAISSRVFPNPASDQLRLTTPDLPVNSVIRIYDVTGNEKQSALTTGNETHISVESLPEGFYFIHIQTPRGITFTEKVLIVR